MLPNVCALLFPGLCTALLPDVCATLSPGVCSMLSFCVSLFSTTASLPFLQLRGHGSYSELAEVEGSRRFLKVLLAEDNLINMKVHTVYYYCNSCLLLLQHLSSIIPATALYYFCNTCLLPHAVALGILKRTGYSEIHLCFLTCSWSACRLR